MKTPKCKCGLPSAWQATRVTSILTFGFLGIPDEVRATSAIQTFDTSRYAIDIVKTDEEEAEKLLEDGKLAAYVILPDNFIEEALYGNIKTITYVTTPGAVDTMSLFKEEVTKVISGILAESQKGVYGIGGALDDNGHSDISNDRLNELNLEYIDLILDRAQLYETKTVESADDGVPFQIYLFSGIAVFMVCLVSLPYALLYVKRDMALHRTLAARGYAPWRQLLCEYIAYAVAVFVLLAIVLAVLPLFMRESVAGLPGGTQLLWFAVELLPVVITVTAFGFLVFELAGNVVSGVLLQFFLTLALCYVSGCLYPLYVFPQSVQTVAVFLPTAMAREHLTACLMDAPTAIQPLIGMFAYTVAFLVLTMVVRHRRIVGRGGSAA